MELLASARSHFVKHTEDAQIMLEQFNLLDPPLATTSQSPSDANLTNEDILAVEHRATKLNVRRW